MVKKNIDLEQTGNFPKDSAIEFNLSAKKNSTLTLKLLAPSWARKADVYINNEKPRVYSGQSLKEVIVEMTQKRLGITAVVDKNDKLLGIITDGDLRRMLEKNSSIASVKADDIMTPHPITIGADEMAIDALDLLRTREITQLAVTENGKYLGIIHLHDLIREGLI